MPVVDDSNAPPSMTTHARLAAEQSTADEEQRQIFSNDIASLASKAAQERSQHGHVLPTTRSKILSLSIATTATAYRLFPEGSTDLAEGLAMGRGLASKTGLEFDAKNYERQLKEIKRISWSSYSQEQFEAKVEGYIEQEVAKAQEVEDRKRKRRESRQSSGGLESIKEVEEMAEAVGLTFESG